MTAKGFEAGAADETAAGDPTASSRLATLLRLVEGAWALAVFENDDTRRRTMTRLRSELGTVPVVELSLLEERRDVLSLLELHPVADGDSAPAMFFTAVSSAMPALASQLDLQREALARLPHRLVFWVSEAERRRLADRAPNFYSRLSGVFRFSGTVARDGAPDLPVAPAHVPEPRSSYRWRPRIEVDSEEERARRIARVKARIHDLRSLERPDHQAIGDSWHDLAGLYEGARRPDWLEAETAYGEAARAYARAQVLEAEARSLLQAAEAAFRSYSPMAAERHLLKALSQFALVAGSRAGQGEALARERLGYLRSFQSRLSEAEASYGEALGGFEEIGDRLGVANVRQSLGRLHSLNGRDSEAEVCFDQALGFYREIGDAYSSAVTLIYRGQGHFRQGRLDRCSVDWEEALRLALRLEPKLLSWALGSVSRELRGRLEGEGRILIGNVLERLVNVVDECLKSVDADGNQRRLLDFYRTVWGVIALVRRLPEALDPGEIEAQVRRVREAAAAVDEASNGVFHLAELAESELAALTSTTQP